MYKVFIDSEGTKMKFNLNSVTRRIEHWNIVKLTNIFIVIAVIIGVFTAWFWYKDIYMSPERRFWSAINNSMATPSVVRTLTDGGTGNQVVQSYRFHYAPQTVVENSVLFTEKSATADTQIETEGVITRENQYLRYTDFKNKEQEDLKSPDGDSLIGIWASGGESQPASQEAQLNYTSEQVTLAIFGNFSPQFRNEIISEMKSEDIYGIKFDRTAESEVDGRTQVAYQISVKLKAYVELLQKSFIESGLGEFPPLSPENYQEDAKVNGTIIIDKTTNSIVSIDFGGRTEKYSNYGVIKNVDIPEAKITIDELQNQVQASIQQSGQ